MYNNSTLKPTKKKIGNDLPDEILQEIQEKNQIRQEWQRNRDPATKQFIKYILKPQKQDE